jgi:hypothetical protein
MEETEDEQIARAIQMSMESGSVRKIFHIYHYYC